MFSMQPAYQFHLFKPYSDRVPHGVFGRVNVSGGFAANGDVALNRRKIVETLGGARVLPLSLKQTHGCDVVVVKHPGHIEALQTKDISGDALVTALPEVPLLIQTADCQAIFLWSTQGVIANIHAGWRGLVRGVIEETIRVMREAYHVSTDTIVAGIAPSLGPCCAEFHHRDEEFPQAFRKYFAPGDRVNLWWASVEILERCGVGKERIEVSGLCTMCHRDTFFSHRGDVPDCGRSGNVIFLRHA